MNNLIKQIEITNFRSIKHTIIDCTSYNLFCGQNDVGKSNVLKALNLFFNQETDFQTPFNFFTDYNKYALAEAQSSKKGKQFIRIKVTFNTPRSYKSIPNQTFYIEKTYDRNDRSGSGTTRYSEDSTIARTSISRLYNQIRYVYIPALKGKEVVQYLLGLLGEQQLIGQKQIDELNQHINEKTQNLTGLLNESNIGINVTFGLPTLLRDFWQQLSVGTNYEYIEKITQQISKKKGAEVDLNPKLYQIPLTMRGDGIKSKFLPPILKWLQNNNQSMIFIWGIDEPENSLEFRAAEALSTLFCDEYAKTTQIFATSHSMAFINPRETAKVKPTIFRTMRSKYGETEFRNIDDLFKDSQSTELLEEIGALEIQQKLISTFREQIDAQIKAQQTFEAKVKDLQAKIEKLKKPLVITEGKTDIKHIKKAQEKLGMIDIDFEQIDENQQPEGESNLKNLLDQLSKIPHVNKIIGLFDRDQDSTIKDIEKEHQDYKNYGNNVYAFCIPVPQFRIDKGQTKISIEYLYTDDEIKTPLENGCRLFFGTEFMGHSLLHNTEPLILKHRKGNGEDKIIENNGDQAVFKIENNKEGQNVLAKKNDFAEAILHDKIQISVQSWENFRPIFDKIKRICEL